VTGNSYLPLFKGKTSPVETRVSPEPTRLQWGVPTPGKIFNRRITDVGDTRPDNL
jgi:hypothetical protein